MASRSRHVTDEMFFTAAKTVAGVVDEDDLSHGRTYPPFDKIGEVSLEIATAVAEQAWDAGLADAQRPKDIRSYIESLRYDPTYHTYV